MASLIHSESQSCSKAEQDLFTVPSTQMGIESDSIISINPINSVGGNSLTPIEFLIPGSADNFIDLSNVYMYLKVQIVNGDGSDVQSTIQVYPECNFLQTFFSECEISLNGKK